MDAARDELYIPLPLGALLATATVRGVWPIKSSDEPMDETWDHPFILSDDDTLMLFGGPVPSEDLSTYRHSADWSPGRFAVLLDERVAL